MPPRFIPVGGQGGSGGGFQGGGRFQSLGGGGAQIPQFFSAHQSRFVPVHGGAPTRQQGRPTPTFSPPSPLPGLLSGTGALANLGGTLAGSSTLSGVGGALNIAGGAATLAEGGNNLSKAQGTTQIAGGGATLANALGADIPFVGPALALAGVGEGLAAGSQAGDRAAVRAIMSAFPVAGPIFAAADLGTNLINMGLGEGYQRGDLSKAIMQAKQTALQQGATAGVDTALTNAQSYPQILQVLSQIPPGTGQLQYGVGQNYTGETTVGGPSLTQTPGWQQTLTQAQQDPTNFIKNFWVKTGQSGATGFDAGLTRSWQTKMIQALPEGPLKASLMDWATGTVPTDPGGSDFAAADQAYQAWVASGRQGLSPYQRIQTQSLYNTLVPQAQDLLTYSSYRGNPEAAQAALSQINPLAQQLGYAPFSLPLPPDSPPADTSAFSGG